MMQRPTQDGCHKPGGVFAQRDDVFSRIGDRLSSSTSLAVTALVGLGLVACAPRFRQETMGTGTANLGSGASATGTGVNVSASPDDLKIAYRITMPRALLLQYAIECPAESRTGTLGETKDDYTKRRLAELEAQRQRDVQTKASVIGAVVGQVQGGAAVETPNASAEVNVAADGSALGQSIGEQTTASVQLSPLDTGGRTLGDSVQVRGGAAGQCAMRMWSEVPGQDLRGVVATYEVLRIVDKKRESEELRSQRMTIALGVRASVSTSLLATGADPEYRAKLARAEAARVAQERAAALEASRVARAHEAQLRAEAAAAKAVAVEAARVARAHEARLRGEAAVNVAVSPPAARVAIAVPPPAARGAVAVPPPAARVAVAVPPPAANAEAVATASVAADQAQRERLAYAAAVGTRNQLVAWLVANGADPYHRARLRQQQFNQREQEARGRIDAEREASRRAAVSLQVSLQTRETLVAWLVANGADPEFRRKQNEADLASFEVRSRALQDQRRRDAVLAQGTAGVSVDASVSVVSTTPPTTRPAPIREVRTPQPTPEAIWIDGFYEWAGGEWVWLAGTWSQPPVQDAIWIPTVEVNLGGRTVIRPGSWRTSAGIRVQGGTPTKQPRNPRVRDHRR